jgi:hypothetical protein
MKAHRTDGVSLTFALIFLGVVAWWLVAQILDLALPAVGWFLAGGLILLGLLGLLGALRSSRPTPPPAAVPAGPTSGAPAGPTSGGYTDPVSGPSYPAPAEHPAAPGTRWAPGPAIEPTTAPPATGGDERG